MYCSGGGSCCVYSLIQSSSSLVYACGITTLVSSLEREIAVLKSITIVWILFSLSVYSCSYSWACSRAKLLIKLSKKKLKQQNFVPYQSKEFFSSPNGLKYFIVFTDHISSYNLRGASIALTAKVTGWGWGLSFSSKIVL